MVDLHTHTNYSDGTWSVKRLLEEAEKSNIAPKLKLRPLRTKNKSRIGGLK